MGITIFKQLYIIGTLSSVQCTLDISNKSFADFKVNLWSSVWCDLSKVYRLLCVLLQGQVLEEGEQVEHRSSLKVLDQGGDQIVHLNKSINLSINQLFIQIKLINKIFNQSINK